MRIIYFLLLVGGFISCKTGNCQIKKQLNYIDSIQSAKEIETLLQKINQPFFEYFKVNTETKFTDSIDQKIADSLKVKPWAKADFDNNGLTDILVIGSFDYYCILTCILDEGNNKYKSLDLTKRATIEKECASFPVVTTENNTAKIEYAYFASSPDPYNNRLLTALVKETLVYKSGGFVEENKQPTVHSIEKIVYSSAGCLGHCPVFNLEILADRSAFWYANRNNEINAQKVTGNFKTTVSASKYKELIDLINYLDFEKLKDNYRVPWSDAQACTITITYDNGKTKTINDFGLLGTFGLNTLYKLLFNLRENQQWTKMKK